MNAITPAFADKSLRADRATRLTDQFEAWRINDDGQNRTRGFGKKPPISSPYSAHAVPVTLGNPATLKEAIDEAAPTCHHKDRLIIRRTDQAGNRRLHFYAIKQEARAHYVYDRETYTDKAVHRLYAEWLFDLDLAGSGAAIFDCRALEAVNG